MNGAYYKAEANSHAARKLASIGNGSDTKRELAEIVDGASYPKILTMVESAREGIECTNVLV